MNAHRICDLTVDDLFMCIFNLGPHAVNMLRAPRYLNPALLLLLHCKGTFTVVLCISIKITNCE